MEYKYKRECGPVVEKLTREGEVAGSGHFGFRVKKILAHARPMTWSGRVEFGLARNLVCNF